LLDIKYANPRTVLITGVLHSSDGVRALIRTDMLVIGESQVFTADCVQGAPLVFTGQRQ
jgi:hypothetical protein